MCWKKSANEIKVSNQIYGYVHCTMCLAEQAQKPVSPKEYQSVQVGYTPIGLQIWCKRHEVNVMHIDYEGVRHPVNTGVLRA